MTATIIKAVEFDELVERDVRENCTPQEKAILASQKDRWRQSLKHLKRKTEGQFTMCKSRKFAAHAEYQAALCDENVSDDDLEDYRQRYMATMSVQLEWRHKANFFLSKIEQKLQEVNTAA